MDHQEKINGNVIKKLELLGKRVVFPNCILMGICILMHWLVCLLACRYGVKVAPEEKC